MNEFELIQQCFADWPIKNNRLIESIGDDCLVWQSHEPLVISTDTAVSGRHFPTFASAEQVAARAFLPALSDLAAMTAKPEFFTLALSLPTLKQPLDKRWVRAFAKQLKQYAQHYQIALAGGDTTSAEQLTVTISVHGRCAKPVLRSGAQLGDDIWVTGHLGQAAAGLPYVLAKSESQCPQPAWLQAYWQPQPPVAFSQALQGHIHSAIDLSDGLVGDAEHLAKRSEVTLAIDLAAIPMDAELKQQDEGLKLALSGGDDYQLLFTAKPELAATIRQHAQDSGVQVNTIGQVLEGNAGVRWYDAGREINLPWQSFTHF